MTDQILAANIANQLRRNILQGKILPGAAIKERENAMEMGVSRTPLREAIRILATEGLLELRPARSPIVSVPTIKQVTDDVEVLLSVEKLSAELACERATDAEIDALSDIVDDMAARFDTAERTWGFTVRLPKPRITCPWRKFMASFSRGYGARVIWPRSGAAIACASSRDPKASRDAIGDHLRHLREDIIHSINEEQAAAKSD